MNDPSSDLKELAQLVASLRADVGRLNERLNALEMAMEPQANVATPKALNDELVAIIGSVIATFLGKKPHIRQIQLISSPAWGMQGRVTIQASHTMGSQPMPRTVESRSVAVS